ncbi:Tat-linked quality control protein TatD, partial [Tetrabaena socialis]
LPGVLRRAREANVRSLIVTGTSIATSEAAARLCDAHAHAYPLFFTAGVHPHNAKQCTAPTLGQLRELAAHPRCVAMGECGLDFNRNFSPPGVQEKWFEEQILLARELRLPLFMHCRDASDRFAEILSRHLPLPAPAVVHCFTGSRQDLDRFLGLGLYIGITGWICDDRPERGGAELASLLASIPRERLMLETDAPYLVPRSIKPSKARPGRNEPALLPHVLVAAAAAIGVTPEELGRSSTEVACRVFGIPPDQVLGAT